MQKIGQFYVTYQNIVQFDHNLWKLDYFEKSVLELMADPVGFYTTYFVRTFSFLLNTSVRSYCKKELPQKTLITRVYTYIGVIF